MTAIREIETILLDLPTIRPHILSMTTMNTQTVLLVRVRCEDGIEGLGEGTTVGGLSYGDESPEGMKANIDTYIAPLLKGRDATRPAAAMAFVGRAINGNNFARCAVEMALLDAHGKRVGLPVSELIGGRRRDRLPVLWVLASGDTGRDIEEAHELIASGRQRAFKLKIGKAALADDIAHVAAIKRALGEEISIRVDVNAAWDERTARVGVAKLAHVGVELIEQPVARDRRAVMARLVAMGRVPIMADESLRGPVEAFELAQRGAADVFALKIGPSGGLAGGAAVAAIAAAAGIALYGGTMLESGLGTAAAAHLFSSLPDLEYGTELFAPLLMTNDIVGAHFDYRDASLAVPTGPGLGVTLDEERVTFHRRDRSTTHLSARS